jgi:two-component system, chemotaxis family, protein-glutamate methylesterase/glutaminase
MTLKTDNSGRPGPRRRGTDMIRVLVAEDSDTTRALMVQILRDDSSIEVIGEARDGLEAIEMTCRLKPDLVTMDIQMPRVDGFTATEQIMMSWPVPIVVVSSIAHLCEAKDAARALSCGALTVLRKPSGVRNTDFSRSARELIAVVKAMAQVKVVRRHSWPRPTLALPPLRARSERPRVLAIAASTGGPAALRMLLPALSPDFPIPILVVQHITAGFIGGLVESLAANVSLPVKLAEAGETLSGGTIYFAPDDCHLGIAVNLSATLSSAAPIRGFRPSANFLFETAANACGPATLAVILTGMGNDGLDGLQAVKRRGGCVIAQDEETSVVFGMPGAAIGAGVADAVLALDAIGGGLNEMVGVTSAVGRIDSAGNRVSPGGADGSGFNR